MSNGQICCIQRMEVLREGLTLVLAFLWDIKMSLMFYIVKSYCEHAVNVAVNHSTFHFFCCFCSVHTHIYTLPAVNTYLAKSLLQPVCKHSKQNCCKTGKSLCAGKKWQTLILWGTCLPACLWSSQEVQTRSWGSVDLGTCRKMHITYQHSLFFFGRCWQCYDN